jgi:hypothetical protein
MIKSYSELFKALKFPLEPKGDPALLSKREGKTIVSIPLDIAIQNMIYLQGIEPIPLIHRPERLGRDEFTKKVNHLQKGVNTIQRELRNAKLEISKAKKLLKKTKQLRQYIDIELEDSKKNMKKLEKDLDELVKGLLNAYYHLCEVFKLERNTIDLSSKNALDSTFSTMAIKYEEAQKIFSQDLIQQIRNYPEILEKFKISEEKDFANIIKQVRKEFEERIKEVTKFQEEYNKVNDWILRNTVQLKAFENKTKTIVILNDALLISQAIFSRIFQKSDINRIIEDLSGKIEEKVKDIFCRMFPEDTSFNFSHSSKGQFLSTINNEPITHPSGSQRAAISVGIMLSLAHTFGLPMILDEAFDRIDTKRLKFFCECMTGLASSNGCQTVLAGYKSFNIEKNPEVLPFVNGWKTYLVEKTEALEKNIKPLKGFIIVE